MYQFVWECWCNLSPWDYFIINSICGSILQDKHLEKAYEINLMEELTLKGITQVSSITGSLFLAWQRTGNLAIPQTKWPVNVYLFPFCPLAVSIENHSSCLHFVMEVTSELPLYINPLHGLIN